ncbi:rhodopirellula transposase [Holospora obtusa F1]|uniref:Rhodopirellula transposase n=1 Tax=Holospora obtusa F1 TaxID=1399147 RepID=W6TE02_HOLOB|nr:hypothetical protein [Holospora obtusa]ETZ07318.1 rhodopirellula transposase [Holospora obtusa F1]
MREGRRLWAVAEARSYGYGGIVSKATQTSNKIIDKGLKELDSLNSIDKTRIRAADGGRKSVKNKHSDILKIFEALVDPTTRGAPESPLKWTSKSVRKLEEAKLNAGYSVSYRNFMSLVIVCNRIEKLKRDHRTWTKTLSFICCQFDWQHHNQQRSKNQCCS